MIGIVINDHEKCEFHALEAPFTAASLNYPAAKIDRCGQFMMVKTTAKTDDIIRFAFMWNLGNGILRSGGNIHYIMCIDLIGTRDFGVPPGLFAGFVLQPSIPYVYFILSLDECARFDISLTALQKRR